MISLPVISLRDLSRYVNHENLPAEPFAIIESRKAKLVEKQAEIEKKIESHIKGMMGIGVKVRLVEPKLIARSEGKAKRIIDERPKD